METEEGHVLMPGKGGGGRYLRRWAPIFWNPLTRFVEYVSRKMLRIQSSGLTFFMICISLFIISIRFLFWVVFNIMTFVISFSPRQVVSYQYLLKSQLTTSASSLLGLQSADSFLTSSANWGPLGCHLQDPTERFIIFGNKSDTIG